MNKITKMILGAICALALVTSTFAADTVATAKTATVQTTQTSDLSLFNAKEFGLSLASGYTLGGNVSSIGATSFQQPYALNFNAGAFYFPWRNLGFEANVPFYQSKGVSVSEVQAGLVLRLPLSKETVILKNLSPYIGVDAVYNWNSTQEWAYIGKVGLEARLNKNWGVFVEGQYRNSEFKDWGNGQATLNGGLRLIF